MFGNINLVTTTNRSEFMPILLEPRNISNVFKQTVRSDVQCRCASSTMSIAIEVEGGVTNLASFLLPGRELCNQIFVTFLLACKAIDILILCFLRACCLRLSIQYQ
ncbi:hypothetical protein KL918_000003 [Ogataea parapolymorpha]|nr:hypothetical protein KL916_005298 [Ogataea parapolymorpha]KAG7869799.1 hypothetical protein KL918_000003 [Ogataea parapolymorpha]